MSRASNYLSMHVCGKNTNRFGFSIVVQNVGTEHFGTLDDNIFPFHSSNKYYNSVINRARIYSPNTGYDVN